MAPTVTAELGCPSSQRTLNISSGKPGNLPGSALTGSAQMFISNAAKMTGVTSCDREEVVQRKLAVLSQQVKTVKEERNQHLMSMCLKTLELSSKNRKLQEQLNDLREQTRRFMQSINPSTSVCQTQMTKSLTHVPVMITSRTALTTLPVPLNLNFPAQNSSSFVQFRSVGSTTSFTPLATQQTNFQKSFHVPTAQRSTSHIQSATLNSYVRSPSPILLPGVQTKADNPLPAPIYQEGINAVNADKNLTHLPLSTKVSTISTEISGTIPLHDQPINITATSDPKVYCSCCSDDSHANQNNFYTLLNDLAANWINRLNGDTNSTSSAIHRNITGPLGGTTQNSPSQWDGLQKRNKFETNNPTCTQHSSGIQNFSPLQNHMSRKRYLSNTDEDPVISVKRKCNGSESSFGSFICASPLLNTSDSSEDGMDSLRVDASEMMQLTSIDDLGLSDDSI